MVLALAPVISVAQPAPHDPTRIALAATVMQLMNDNIELRVKVIILQDEIDRIKTKASDPSKLTPEKIP